MFAFFRRRRRAGIKARPFPGAWRAILLERVPLYEELDSAEQSELEGHIQILIAEKTFEGCGGFEITDEVKVTIAAHAALLLVNRETDYYPRLDVILVYPSGYLVHGEQVQPDGTVVEGPSHRLGESWTSGVIVLSWDDVLQGAANVKDGQNVTVHEFAHQLDQEDGAGDGVPTLDDRSAYRAWGRALAPEFELLKKKVARGERTKIDAYGATNDAEFFAVITEAFFEQPYKLQRHHPEVYAELASFYKQDPAARRRARRAAKREGK